MRYAPRAILAGGLGFAVSCLAACGGSAGLLSGDQSIALSGQGNEINSAVQSGDCGAAVNASAALNIDVQKLPITVNPTLRANLTQGAVTISQLAARECHQHASTTSSTATSTPSTTTSSSTSSTTTPTTSTSTSSTTTTSTTTSTATTPPNTGTTSTTTGGVGLGGTTSSTTGTGTGTSGGTGPGDGNSGGNGNGQ
jgi:hypothetical protein